MVDFARNPLEHLQALVRKVSAHHLSCSLTFYPASLPPIRLVFKLGRIVWATGGEHRFRRWHRLNQKFLPRLTQEVSSLYPPVASSVWEYQLLMLLLRQNCVSRECASQLIQTALEEVIFEIFQLYPDFQRIDIEQLPEYKTLESLIFPPLDKSIKTAHEHWCTWHEAGLRLYSPNTAPFVVNPEGLRQQTSPKTYQNMLTLLRGQLPLRELAQGMGKSAQVLTQLLQPYVAQNLIVLRRIADYAPPWLKAEQVSDSAVETQQGPLVYCVDDSTGVCTSLQRIVEQRGYRFSYTQDSVDALQSIIEKRPDLIFVDLIMPIMSGYEICTQIRRIQMFEEIPIIILTSSDGVVDRVRSKFVGATEFAAKPVTMKRIIPLLDKYVPLGSSELSASNQMAVV